MKKATFIILICIVFNLVSGCFKQEQKSLDLNKFGFENFGGMCKWLQITDYDFEKGYAEFSREKIGQYILEFKEHTLISSYCTGNNLGSVSKTLQTFQILDNDSALVDEKPILITERIVQNNMLVIKVLRQNSEYLFILEDTITTMPEKNLNIRYYFKNDIEKQY